MKKEKAIILILGIFLVSLVSAYDPQLHNCWGDEELVICYPPSDDQLIWLSGELPEEELFTGAGMGAEYLNISNSSLFSFGGNLVGSYDFVLASQKVITPYGRLNLRGERVDVSVSGWSGEDDTDFNVAFCLGCSFQMTSEWNMIAEFQIDDNIGIIGGLSYYIF